MLVHVVGARLTGQPRAAGLLASAQLGVPSAIVALGLTEHVITPTQGAAIIAAAMISLAVCSAGAALLAVGSGQSGDEAAVRQDQPARTSTDRPTPSRAT